ncbi:MAG: hypothetical protein KC931_21740 [Candidatus Omnitrophica bacterium]|nr:hypothetical protein [Candidatus Omnitrophota bacterium]
MEEILDKKGYSSLITDLNPDYFMLEGTSQSSLEEFQRCLTDLSAFAELSAGQFRCYGNDRGQVWDLILIDDKFFAVPLELQPTLDALDDPLIRDYYGLEYCVVRP